MNNIIEFDSSGDAYNESQTDAVKKGDLLLVESEKAIAIAETWPFAPHPKLKGKEFHSLRAGVTADDYRNGTFKKSIIEALKIAIDKGWITINEANKVVGKGYFYKEKREGHY